MSVFQRSYYSMFGKGIIVLVSCVALWAINVIKNQEKSSLKSYKIDWIYGVIDKIDSIPTDSLSIFFSKSIPVEQQRVYIQKIRSRRVREFYSCDVKSVFENNKNIEIYTFKNKTVNDSFSIYIGSLDRIYIVKDE